MLLSRSKNLSSFKHKNTSLKKKLKTKNLRKSYGAPPPKDERVKDSFLRGVFFGELRENKLFPYPDQVMDTEQRELVKLMEPGMKDFYANVNKPMENDANETVPKDVMQALADLGGFGLQVPTDLEGAGLSNTGYAKVVEMAGYGADLGLGILVGAHQSIGFKGILIEGNEEQKKKYLPDLATGRKIAAFALTEPSSGSDANSIRTKAVLSSDGKHFILNGSKIWISNGGIADVMTVFAQTEVDDPKTGGKKNKVTALIVERAFGGVTNGPPEKKMGIKASNTAEVYFKDTKVPIENVIGEVGGGFKVAMRILNNGRFGMGAALTGCMKYCLEKATFHAANRDQFGRKISNFEVIKEKLTNMTLRIYATESMAYMVSAMMDSGSQDYELEAASLKVYASDSAWYVCDEAIQILGGNGFMRASELERVLRDLRVFRIFEGTNEILRLLVSSGINDLGKKMKSEGVFGYTKGIFSRYLGSDKPKLKMSAPELAPSAARIEELTSDFHKAATELIMEHKITLIERQIQLTRIANIAIHLFAMTAVTSRASRAIEKKKPNYEKDILIANTFTKKAAAEIYEILRQIRNESCRIDDSVQKIADSIITDGYNLHPPVETDTK